MVGVALIASAHGSSSMLSAKHVVELVGALGILVLLDLLFVKLERNGRRVEIFTVILGLVLFESFMWDQSFVPSGPFHPHIGTQSLHIYDILIPVALLARLQVRGVPRRISLTGGAWLLFCAWYFVEAIVGLISHHGLTNVNYEARLILEIGGGYALGAGVSAEELLGDRGLRRLVLPFGIVSVVLMAFTGHRGLSFPVPGLRTNSVGGIQPDAASLFVCLGIVGLLLELARPRISWVRILASIALLATPAAVAQRASFLSLGAAVALALVMGLTPVARRRLRVTPTEFFVAVGATVSGVLAYPLLNGKDPFNLRALPLGRQLYVTFLSTQKAQSAAERVSQLHAAWPLIREHPLLGWGLGQTITFDSTGFQQIVVSPITHNIYLDLALRTGAVGFVLFASASLISIGSALRVWFRHSNRAVAVLALGAACAFTSLLVHGSVESIFEKYRLALSMGLWLGVIGSTVASLESSRKVRAISSPLTVRQAGAPVTSRSGT